MTSIERAKFIQEFYETNCTKLMTTKGKEYSLSGEDVNSNFKRTGIDIGINPKIVLYIFMKKHFDAITNYIKTNKIESESIEGRIADLINYGFILASLIEEEKLEAYKDIKVNIAKI